MIKRNALCLAMLFSAIALGAETLTLAYFERAPYYHTERGEPGGFLLERARRALEAANVRYEVRALPSTRIQAVIEGDTARMISVGWFKTPEREAVSRFSIPIYRNLSQVALTRAPLARELSKAESFEALARDGRYTLGVLQGFSYGEYVDSAIGAAGKRVVRVNASASQLVSMLASGRFDYMIADPEEVSFLIAESMLPAASFATVSFTDIPQGNLRYLWCSRSVTASEIERINAAIGALYPDVR